MSTPGLADGVIQQWINGVQTMDVTNQRMRGVTLTRQNSPTAQFHFVRLYTQHGVGTIYYDDYAVSRDARIGPLESATIAPAQEPKNAPLSEPVPAIDAQPHREAIISVLKQNKFAGSHATLSLLGKDEDVLLEKFDPRSLYVTFSGNSILLPWETVSHDNLAKIALACGPDDGDLLFHSGALAIAAKNISLTKQIRGRLRGVDAEKNKKLDELIQAQ
jgi:hypothetical protein